MKILYFSADVVPFEKSLLDDINISEQLPSILNNNNTGKRTSICFYTIGINAGAIATTNTQQILKYSLDEEKVKIVNEEEYRVILEEESEKDEFVWLKQANLNFLCLFINFFH